MSNWLSSDETNSLFARHSTFVIFCIAASSALILFVALKPIIEDVTSETDDAEKVDYFGFIRRLPLNKQVALMQKIPPQYQAMVFTQMNSEDISQLIQQLPKLDALAAVLSLKEVEASPRIGWKGRKFSQGNTFEKYFF